MGRRSAKRSSAARFSLIVVLPGVLAGIRSSQGQEACDVERYVCFEQGQVQFDSPDDIAAFLADWHSSLGLTGDETFDCRRHDWLGERLRFPTYVYQCVQTVVQGYATKDLNLRLDFWDGEGNVRTARCQCVSEDAPLAAPRVRADEAAQRGLRYVYAHYPEVDPGTITTTQMRGPFLEPDLAPDAAYPYRTAWWVSYGFPWAWDYSTKDGEWVDRIDDAELTLGIDAVDSSVFQAIDSKRNLHRGNVEASKMDAFKLEVSAIADPVQQFDAYQQFWAFSGRGERMAAPTEARVRSLAEWDPNGRSRFRIYFSRGHSIAELARFLDDYGLIPELVHYVFRYEGSLNSGFIELGPELRPEQSASIVGRLEETFAEEREKALTAVEESVFVTQRDAALQRMYGLSRPESITVNYVITDINHVGALRLFEEETSVRVLMVQPYDHAAHDLGADWLFN